MIKASRSPFIMHSLFDGYISSDIGNVYISSLQEFTRHIREFNAAAANEDLIDLEGMFKNAFRLYNDCKLYFTLISIRNNASFLNLSRHNPINIGSVIITSITQVYDYIYGIINQLTRLIGESPKIILSGYSAKTGGGHAILLYIEKQDLNYRVILSNSGEGINKHPNMKSGIISMTLTLPQLEKFLYIHTNTDEAVLY